MTIVEGAPPWLIGVLAILLIIAAIQDAAQLKISNITILLVLLAGIAGVVIIGPQFQLWQNAVVLALFIAMGTPLFAAGKLGGGDVKLIAVMGFWFDFAGALGLVVAVLLAGGILALVMIGLRTVKWSKRARERIVVLRPRSGIPYAVAIAAGGLIATLTQRT